MHLCPHYCWVVRLITIAFPFPAIKFVVDVEMGMHISNTNNYQSDFLPFHTQWIATITRFMYDRHRPTYINSLFKAEGTHRRNYNVNAHTHFLNFLHTDTIINLRFGQRTITYAQQCTLQVVVRCPHTYNGEQHCDPSLLVEYSESDVPVLLGVTVYIGNIQLYTGSL